MDAKTVSTVNSCTPEAIDNMILAKSTLTRQICSAQASKSAASGDLEAAIAWCSRALKLLDTDATAPDRDGDAARTNAAAALQLRRAEYAMQITRFDDAVQDADTVLSIATENKLIARTVRLKCRALLAMDRLPDALTEWTVRLGKGSQVLDELAFRREFGIHGATRENNDPRYDTVLQYFYRKDFGNTISLLNKAIDGAKKGKGKSKNKDPVLYLLRARCRIELREYEGAVADAERVITLLPTAVEAYRWLCEALLVLNKHTHAGRVCQLGLSLAPHDEALLRLNEQLQASKKEHDEKRRSRQKTVKVEVTVEEDDREQSMEASVEDGDEEEQEETENRAFEAIRALKRAIKTDARNAELYASLSSIRFGLRQYEQAQSDAAQAIFLDSTTVDGYLRSCEALYALRRYAKALRVCEQGLSMTDAECEVLQAWKLRLQEALVTPPPEEPVEDSGPVTKSRVPKAVAARKHERAQRKVDDAQAQRRKCFEKAVDLADDRDFGNAVFWLNKAESYDAAGKTFYAARIFALRARCRFELKQFEHVARDAARAIALDPTDGDSYGWLSRSFKARGHLDRARETCASGLGVEPAHTQLLSLMKSLQVGTRPSSK